MLKIKDKEKLHEVIEKYDLEYDADSDYESGWLMLHIQKMVYS